MIELFSNILFIFLLLITEKASGLNGDERRIFAEKTALAFWKAMGGDDDELEDTQVNDATESGKEGQDNEKVD